MPWACFWYQVDGDKAGFGHTLLSVLSRLLGQVPVGGQRRWEHGGAGSSSGAVQKSDILASSSEVPHGPRAAPGQEGPMAPQGAHVPETTGHPPPFRPGHAVSFSRSWWQVAPVHPSGSAPRCGSLEPFAPSHQQSQRMVYCPLVLAASPPGPAAGGAGLVTLRRGQWCGLQVASGPQRFPLRVTRAVHPHPDCQHQRGSRCASGPAGRPRSGATWVTATPGAGAATRPAISPTPRHPRGPWVAPAAPRGGG